MYYLTLDEQIAKLKEVKYGGAFCAVGATNEGFIADCERLRRHEPLEYILGEALFLGVRVDMGECPMTPRFETGFWVERAIAELAKLPADKQLRIADTFSGSGNVGLAILKHVPNAVVEFHEYDESLFPGTERSLLLNDIDPARARCIQGDALDGLTGTYDAIFAVPPYVAESALPDLDPEMQIHEPHLAFFGGPDGLKFHRLLVSKGWKYIKQGGTLYMESDMDQEKEIAKMLTGTPWAKMECWPDPYGATPNVVLRI